jgi:hypothetical protein
MLQKQEARFNPYMVACNSIGYFTLLPSAMWPSSCLDSLRFYLPAMPSPPLCYIIRIQTWLLFFWPSSLLH